MSPHEDLAARKLEYEAIPVQESAMRSTLKTSPPQYLISKQEIPDKPVSSAKFQQPTSRQRASEAENPESAIPLQTSSSDKNILEAVDVVKQEFNQ
ncbi:hypothetical protein AC578_11115 [Pseudocercospora eumusae]|uniref:Uncharacterized protein n=1 Tax=Pseudocercospora eumusae TaxID=321146 RepID=A0A139HSM8_9PEZI|nr:hypothetical protein AC578_11115 [Pseudocercospora eumusae]